MNRTVPLPFLFAGLWLGYDIFINCNWVVTRWQYTFTHKQYTEQQNNNRTTQIQTNVEECGPCPSLWVLPFALQLRKNCGKTSVRVRKTSVRLRETSVNVQYTYYQKHPHITKPLQTPHFRTHSYTHTRIHTLQNNIKPPQYKLKQNGYTCLLCTSVYCAWM
jgi:hypothetical protein